MKALVVVVLLFLAASLAFALLAFLVPPPTAPHPTYALECTPPATWHIGSGNCWEVLVQSPSPVEEMVYNILLTFYQGYRDLAMGFAVLAALFLLAAVVIPRLPRDSRFSVPRAVRDIALLGAIAGLVVFAVFVFLDIVTTPMETPGPFVFHNLLSANVKYYTHGGSFYSNLETFGETAFAVFVVATSCAFVYRLREGVLTALGKAVALFAAPALIVFEIALLLFTPVNMPIFAAKFLDGSPLAGILTNWFVLVISSGLFALGLTHRRLRLGVRRES